MTDQPDRLKAIFCQIEAVCSSVSAPHGAYSVGEMRMIADARRRTEHAIEFQIRWRMSNNLDAGGGH
jgi:hypothetical protein